MKYKILNNMELPNYIKAYKNGDITNDNLFLLERSRRTVVIGNSHLYRIDDLPEDVDINYMYHQGGTIITLPSDISLVAFVNKNDRPKWKLDLVKFLISKGLNAKISHNDVVIDNDKIAGETSLYLNDNYTYFGIQISIDIDKELIKKVCKKPHVKEPNGLSYYNITREEVLAALDIKTIE